MGANQSGPQNASQISEQTHGITVVNSTPDQGSEQEVIVLPRRVLPILSVEGHEIDKARHTPDVQLDPKPWIDLVKTIHEFANSRADLVAARQNHLQEKIMILDEHVQKFTDSYINDKHKALARLNDDCRKLEEINKQLHKCTIQSELCVGMLNKLNFLLPDEHKLEALEQQ